MRTHKSRTHDKVLDDTSEADNSSVTEKLPVLEMGECNLCNFKFNTPKAFHGHMEKPMKLHLNKQPNLFHLLEILD